MNRELVQIFPEARPYLSRKRKKFLRKQNEYRRKAIERYKDLYQNDDDRWFWEIYIDVFFTQEAERYQRKAREIKWALERKDSSGEISDADIRRARNYPFEELMEFNRSGFTKCEFHKEKNPSMHYWKKENKVHCFGCGITLNPIDYMMKRNDLAFKEAVKMLR